jgi:predicted nucleotidyltransferase
VAVAAPAAVGEAARERTMKKPDDKLQEIVSRLQRACGDNLLSVVVYGSAAREDFHETFSDVNLLVVVRRLDAAALAQLSEILRWWSREEKLRPPLVMTLEELLESADVFAIELIDIKHSHRTLFGKDVVADIDVPMNLHRVEVEHELRTTLLRLRHHFLLASDNEDELRTVLAKSITSVLTLFRHALIVIEQDAPSDKAQVLQKAGAVFGIEGTALRAILDLRNHGRQPGDVRELYHAYMIAIQKVAHELDVQAPKRQVQKLS